MTHITSHIYLPRRQTSTELCVIPLGTITIIIIVVIVTSIIITIIIIIIIIILIRTTRVRVEEISLTSSKARWYYDNFVSPETQ